MSNPKLLYWYIPTHSQHFTKVEISKTGDFLVKKEIDPELMTFEGEPERGISDAAINNRKYTALLAYYRLDNYSNSEIKATIFLHFAKSAMESKDRIPDSIVNESSASTKAIPDEKSRDLEERVVALWRVHWYSIKSIWAAMLIRKERVNHILSKYRSLVKKQWRVNKKYNLDKRMKITHEYINKVNEIWQQYKDRPIYAKNVRSALWRRDSREKIPSDTTIRNIMKTKLGMSYRLLEKKHKKSINNEGSRSFIHACALQIELINRELELIYIDEFSFSSRK